MHLTDIATCALVGTYVVSAVVFRLSPNLPLLAAPIALVVTGILLAMDDQDLADQMGFTVFYLLAGGAILFAVERFREASKEGLDILSKARHCLATHRAADVGLVVLITLLATNEWFNPGFPRGHDAMADVLLAQMGRESVFNHGMLSGWINEWYMGLPLFQVHPPLVHVAITALSFPFGWVFGTKLLYLSFYALSGVFAYLYTYEVTRSRLASLAAGLAYVFVPYHVLDMGFEGHHGAFGMPYMLTPLILLCFERLVKKPSAMLVFVTSLLLAVLTLSYPQVLPFLIGPFLVLYVSFRIADQWKQGKQVGYPLLASLVTFCLALSLTAFWWLPLVSDIQNFQQTQFPAEAAKEFSATFPQALSLRPETCCAPAGAYDASGSVFVHMVRMLPLALVILGVALNIKNRVVWFFSASIVITWLLAMGPHSPIDIFGFAHNHIPFFSGIRTPVRFLLFTSLAYAVLIGFCSRAVGDWLKGIHLRRSGLPELSLLALLIIILILVSNTWKETRTAFTTFTLATDKEAAYAWLKEQEDGDYRLAAPPFETWVYDPGAGNMINPAYWTFLHGKETVGGGVPAMAVKYTGSTLESLNSDLANGPLDMSAWLDVFNVKYLLVSKSHPLSRNIIISEDLERVWSSKTIDIYENRLMLPRLFSFAETDERVIDLSTGNIINLIYGEGTQEALLSLSSEHQLHQELAVRSTYCFSTSHDYLCLEVNVEGVSFGYDDAIRLAFYSEHDLPAVHLSLGLYERDDSRYDVVIGSANGIKSGWNEVSFPLSLLNLRYSVDENAQLDRDQIHALSVGIGRQGDGDQHLSFDIYFDQLSIVSQEINTSVEYTSTRPGEYQVRVNSDSPSYVILSESYHPNWAARIEGQTIQSEIMYECLNAFHLEPGEYDVTLAFTPSPLRRASGVITAATIVLCCLMAALLLFRRKPGRRPAIPRSSDPEKQA